MDPEFEAALQISEAMHSYAVQEWQRTSSNASGRRVQYPAVQPHYPPAQYTVEMQQRTPVVPPKIILPPSPAREQVLLQNNTPSQPTYLQAGQAPGFGSRRGSSASGVGVQNQPPMAMPSPNLVPSASSPNLTPSAPSPKLAPSAPSPNLTPSAPSPNHCPPAPLFNASSSLPSPKVGTPSLSPGSSAASGPTTAVLPIAQYGKKRPDEEAAKKKKGYGIIMFFHDYLSLKPTLSDYYIGKMSIIAVFLVIFVSFSSAAIMTYFINNQDYQALTISYADYFKDITKNPTKVYSDIKCLCTNETLVVPASKFIYNTTIFYNNYLHNIYEDTVIRLNYGLNASQTPYTVANLTVYFDVFMEPIKSMFPVKVNMTRKISGINVATLDAFYGDTLVDSLQQSTWMLQVPYTNLRDDLFAVYDTHGIAALSDTAKMIDYAIWIQKVFAGVFFDYFYSEYDPKTGLYSTKTLKNILPGFDDNFEEFIAKEEVCGKIMCNYVQPTSALRTFQSCFTLAISIHSFILIICSMVIKYITKKVDYEKNEK